MVRSLRFALFALVAGTAACSSDPKNTSEDGGADGSADLGIDPGTTAKPTDCSAARDALLKPIETVSAGAVTTLATTGDVKRVFVDASAGGYTQAASNPWTYINLATATRVDVTDKEAPASLAWDLALKRSTLYTNGGSGGLGKGAAAFIDAKDIASVTTADMNNLTFVHEEFFNADCEASVDETNAVNTSFSGWYDYDTATSHLTPKAGTYVVKAADGAIYKVQIKDYYATPEGTTGTTGARYVLEIAPLK